MRNEPVPWKISRKIFPGNENRIVTLKEETNLKLSKFQIGFIKKHFIEEGGGGGRGGGGKGTKSVVSQQIFI